MAYFCAIHLSVQVCRQCRSRYVVLCQKDDDLMQEEPAEMSDLDNGEKKKPSETVIICGHTPLR
jgi:hypothetical protein